jgi:hypothetical protein
MRLIGPFEEAAPGILWKLMRSRPQWRHALFAAFSQGLFDDPAEFLHRACGDGDAANWSLVVQAAIDAALRLKPRDLVEIAFGQEPPDGYVGALDKLGFAPAEPEFYGALFRLLTATDPALKARARALTQLPLLTEGRLSAALALRQELVTPTILSRVSSLGAAENLNAKAAAIVAICSGETWTTIRQAIEADQDRSYVTWFQTKLRNADRPFPREVPTDHLSACERVTPANTARIAQEFKNCLSGNHRIFGRLLSGHFALVAWRGAPPVLLELMLLENEGWVCPRIHLSGNAEVSRAVIDAIRDELARLGVTMLIPVSPPAVIKPIKDTLGDWGDPGWDWLEE